jgi:hypothetical protein
MVRRQLLPALIVTIGLLLVFRAAAGSEPRVADAGTQFHRLYIVGNGNDDDSGKDDTSEESSFENDRAELESDLEGNNQAAGSTSRTLNQPTVAQVAAAINKLKTVTQAGDEVTISFIGHGGTVTDTNEAGDNGFDEYVRFSDGQYVKDDDWPGLLSGFPVSVTIVLIMDSCYGGGMTGGADDLVENDHVAVIGMDKCVPMDPPNILRGFVTTPSEDVADGTERDDEEDEADADGNGDGIVTADEMKAYLEDEGWPVGAPGGGGNRTSGGKDKCADCEMPAIELEVEYTLVPGLYGVAGTGFSPSAPLTLTVMLEDGPQLIAGLATVAPDGTFAAFADVPQLPVLVWAEDAAGCHDWAFLGPFQIFLPTCAKDF